jgi:hypothetical protein
MSLWPNLKYKIEVDGVQEVLSAPFTLAAAGIGATQFANRGVGVGREKLDADLPAAHPSKYSDQIRRYKHISLTLVGPFFEVRMYGVLGSSLLGTEKSTNTQRSPLRVAPVLDEEYGATVRHIGRDEDSGETVRR